MASPPRSVDLSKPAYRLGIARIAVGWTPHRLDVNVKPERDSYKVRETAAVDVEVRRADGDALPEGAEIALAAVDEALLELRDNDSWALLDAMMDERGLEVWTVDRADAGRRQAPLRAQGRAARRRRRTRGRARALRYAAAVARARRARRVGGTRTWTCR